MGKEEKSSPAERKSGMVSCLREDEKNVNFTNKKVLVSPKAGHHSLSRRTDTYKNSLERKKTSGLLECSKKKVHKGMV